jgi:hypothetical protein
MKDSYVDIWNELHKKFIVDNEMKYDDWLEDFQTIISNVDTEIIDLGCGITGNNTLYLLERGKKVISCDFAEEALKSVSSNAEITSSKLAVIPTDSHREILCYEFGGKIKESGRNYLIYINALTGEQEQVLLLLESENGILTI